MSNFGSSSLSAPTADQETNKIAEAFNRFSRANKWIKRQFANCFSAIKNKLTNQIGDQPPGEGTNKLSWTTNKGFYPLAIYTKLLHT